MSAYVGPLPVRPAILMPEKEQPRGYGGVQVVHHIMLATASTLALAMTMPAVRKDKPFGGARGLGEFLGGLPVAPVITDVVDG